MEYNKFNKLFEKFCNKNDELVAQYEEQFGEDFSSLSYEIYQYFKIVHEMNKSTDVNSYLFNNIKKSIIDETNLFDILQNIDSYNDEYTITQKYFSDVNKIYNKYNNDYDIEYCPENKDKLISMNLKSVIMIAKRYLGLGLTLNELISAGNLGLCVAFDKFDVNRSKLKENMMGALDAYEGDELNYNDIINIFSEYCKYGDIKTKLEYFNKQKTFTKQHLKNWVNKNIKSAKFNSVACMWIKAYILIEIDNYSRIVKKSKSDICDEEGNYKKDYYLSLDTNISENDDNKLGDMLGTDEDSSLDLDANDYYKYFKSSLNKLLDGVKSRDRRIFFKKFGIGLPRPMLPKEIAKQEDLSVARVSQIFQTISEKIVENQKKYNINPNDLYKALDIINKY